MYFLYHLSSNEKSEKNYVGSPTGSSPISLLYAIMKNLLGFVEQRKKMEAEAPAVQVGATPNRTNGNSTTHNLPKFLQA